MDIRAQIIENSGINNSKGLSILLRDTMYVARDTISVDKMKEAEAFNQEMKASIDFRFQKFLKGLDPLLNNVKTGNETAVAVNLIYTTFRAIGYEIEKEECFILFQMRNLGKFRLKEDKFYNDLEKVWRGSEFEMTKAEYKIAMRELKNGDLIALRRGSITLCDAIIMRY